jgi:hypothetical protein
VKPFTGLPLFLACLAVGMVVPACACFKPANANTKACVVAHQEVDCSKADVQAFAPHLLPLVDWLFSGAAEPFNADDIVAALEHMGFQFIGCSAAELDHDFTSNAQLAVEKLLTYAPSQTLTSTSLPLSPNVSGNAVALSPEATAQRYHQFFARWRQRHADVRFCFRESGSKVCR